jgi:hypothetical protein
MPPKERVQQIIEMFLPHMYCYLGSGMLTNTYDEDIALYNAKACTSYYIAGMVEQWDNYHTINPTELAEMQLKYWLEVKKELHENSSN